MYGAAASHIARFVSSENHNLKYLGIKALASIVQVNQKYALDHQMVVVEWYLRRARTHAAHPAAALPLRYSAAFAQLCCSRIGLHPAVAASRTLTRP